MTLQGKRVAVLAENMYQELELWYPLLRLREAGAETLVVGTGSAATYTSKHGYPVDVDAVAGELTAADVDAVVVPGGYAPDLMRRYPAMVSLVREVRPYDRVSIENIGIVQDGREDTSSEAVKSWAGTHEDYTFKEVEGKTEVLVEMDTDEQNKEMFQGIWPKALKKLKDLVEH